MRFTQIAALLTTLCLAGTLHAQQRDTADEKSVELSLSDEALQARYDTPTDTGGEGSRMFYALFLSEERDVVGSAGLLLGSNFSVGALDIKFGPQAYAALLDEENEDVFALAIGLEARLDLERRSGLAIVGSAYYSPDILTFGSADNLRDFMARAEIRLSDRLIGFAGYRWFELDLLQREKTELQNEIFAGVRWRLE
jgi:hypothetical protein